MIKFKDQFGKHEGRIELEKMIFINEGKIVKFLRINIMVDEGDEENIETYLEGELSYYIDDDPREYNGETKWETYVDIENNEFAEEVIKRYKLGKKTGEIEWQGSIYPRYEFDIEELKKHAK